jgi:DNA-binding transcriptional ArsR family regulator
MSTVAVDQVFSALADATRRHILEILAAQGPASASRISHMLPISRQAIAKHLNLLEQAGLVSSARRGKEMCFQAEPHQLAATGRWMLRLAARWEPSNSLTGDAVAEA